MRIAVSTLNDRRRALKMPLRILVKKSGVPAGSVIRILRGIPTVEDTNHINRVAEVLELRPGMPVVAAEELRKQQATKRARYLRRLVQGTMALEAQGLPEDVLLKLEAETVSRLLSGFRRKLWSD